MAVPARLSIERTSGFEVDADGLLTAGSVGVPMGAATDLFLTGLASVAGDGVRVCTATADASACPASTGSDSLTGLASPDSSVSVLEGWLVGLWILMALPGFALPVLVEADVEVERSVEKSDDAVLLRWPVSDDPDVDDPDVVECDPAALEGEAADDEPDDEDDPESDGLADATHGVAATPTPMPSATANAPTRPT